MAVNSHELYAHRRTSEVTLRIDTGLHNIVLVPEGEGAVVGSVLKVVCVRQVGRHEQRIQGIISPTNEVVHLPSRTLQIPVAARGQPYYWITWKWTVVSEAAPGTSEVSSTDRQQQ